MKENSTLGNIGYGRLKNELNFSGHDMGGRIYIVREYPNYIIAKRPYCKVLCGARGMGMVFEFPTEYYLLKIIKKASGEKLSIYGFRNDGEAEMISCYEFGLEWRKGIELLEQKLTQTKINTTELV